MRAIQKLVRNGNSTQFTLPRVMLIHLEWIPGDSVIVDMLEDGSIRLQKLDIRAAPKVQRRMLVGPRTTTVLP